MMFSFPLFFIDICCYMSYSICSGCQGPLLRARRFYMKRERGKYMHAALMLFSGMASCCATLFYFFFFSLPIDGSR